MKKTEKSKKIYSKSHQPLFIALLNIKATFEEQEPCINRRKKQDCIGRKQKPANIPKQFPSHPTPSEKTKSFHTQSAHRKQPSNDPGPPRQVKIEFALFKEANIYNE